MSTIQDFRIDTTATTTTDPPPTPPAPYSVEGKWLVSTNDENFSGGEYYDTKEDAIRNAHEDLSLSDGDHFYVGQCSEIDLVTDFEPARRMIEGFEEYIYDNAGGDGDDFPTTDAQEKELDDLIRGWMDKHGLRSHRWSVDNVECVTFEQCEQIKGELKPGEAIGADVEADRRCVRILEHAGECSFP